MTDHDLLDLRLRATLRAALDEASGPHPTWAESPARRAVEGRAGRTSSRRWTIRLLGVAALLALGGSTAVLIGSPRTSDPVTVAAGSFGAGPRLAEFRASHTATALRDGRVLVVGGYTGDGASTSADLVAANGESIAPMGSMADARNFHTATLLDDGRVLVVGGTPDSASAFATAEVFDPASGTFAPAGALGTARALHSAAKLVDGRVLIVGGTDDGALIGDAEIWDPATGAFTAGGTLDHPRAWTTTTLLPDGRVLVAGGVPEAELWDPATNAFTPAGTLREPRWWSTATLLPEGRVLVIGGLAGRGFGTGDGSTVDSAELWDPATATFSDAGMLVAPRGIHTASLLGDGRVLVIGGVPSADGDPAASHTSSEQWNPTTSAFVADAEMLDPRSGHTATPLLDGRILVTGGDSGSGAGSRTTELWMAPP